MGKKNRCINCRHIKIAFIRLDGRYLRCKDSFCALYKKLISRDNCCEMWQEQKTDYDLSTANHDSIQENNGIFVINLDDL